MSEPFLAEVRIVGFNFAPRGWAFCDGQILPINQNQSLYSLLGTTYGGDGRTSFALPDLRGRTPMHVGNSHREGQKSGSETKTLDAANMPQHRHNVVVGANDRDTNRPQGSLYGKEANSRNVYHEFNSNENINMRSGMVANTGGGQSLNNMQPFLAVNFCIALQGLFPSRN